MNNPTCPNCGDELTDKDKTYCHACVLERRRDTLSARRRGGNSDYDSRVPAVRLVVPPRCYLAPINCPGCDEGEGLQILSAGRQGVARDYPDLQPGETNWVLR